MEAPTLVQLTTVGGVAIAVALLSELIWRTTAAPDATVERFGPIIAFGLGIVLAVGAGLVLGAGRADIVQFGINGAFAGLSAMGVHDLVTSKGGVTA